MSEEQPFVLSLSAKRVLEAHGRIRTEGDRFYVGREWVVFEEPMPVVGGRPDGIENARPPHQSGARPRLH